jgi:hypothetical protein
MLGRQTLTLGADAASASSEDARVVEIIKVVAASEPNAGCDLLADLLINGEDARIYPGEAVIELRTLLQDKRVQKMVEQKLWVYIHEQLQNKLSGGHMKIFKPEYSPAEILAWYYAVKLKEDSGFEMGTVHFHLLSAEKLSVLFAAFKLGDVSSLDLSIHAVHRLANQPEKWEAFLGEISGLRVTKLTIALDALPFKEWMELFEAIELSDFRELHLLIPRLELMDDAQWDMFITCVESLRTTKACFLIHDVELMTNKRWYDLFTAIERAGSKDLNFSVGSMFDSFSAKQWQTFFAGVKFSGITGLQFTLIHLPDYCWDVFFEGLAQSGLLKLACQGFSIDRLSEDKWEFFKRGIASSNVVQLDLKGVGSSNENGIRCQELQEILEENLRQNKRSVLGLGEKSSSLSSLTSLASFAVAGDVSTEDALRSSAAADARPEDEIPYPEQERVNTLKGLSALCAHSLWSQPGAVLVLPDGRKIRRGLVDVTVSSASSEQMPIVADHGTLTVYADDARSIEPACKWMFPDGKTRIIPEHLAEALDDAGDFWEKNSVQLIP